MSSRDRVDALLIGTAKGAELGLGHLKGAEDCHIVTKQNGAKVEDDEGIPCLDIQFVESR